MRIWFISDSHEQHHKLVVPPFCDAVICCGDEANSHEPWRNAGPSQVFFNWFRELPIPQKFFVPGNHSTAFHEGLVETPGVKCLTHGLACIDGFTPPVTLFGSPWTPSMPRGRRWPYTRKRNTMEVVWSEVPYAQILVTHGPPKGIMDLTYDTIGSKQLVHVGCKSLANLVEKMRPEIHAFGHTHDEAGCPNRGVFVRDGIKYVNCSCVNLRGKLVGNGEVIDL